MDGLCEENYQTIVAVHLVCDDCCCSVKSGLIERGFVILTSNKIPRHIAGTDSLQQVRIRVIGNASPQDQVSRAPFQNPKVTDANQNHTVGGKMILPSSGKKIFTSVGKHFLT